MRLWSWHSEHVGIQRLFTLFGGTREGLLEMVVDEMATFGGGVTGGI